MATFTSSLPDSLLEKLSVLAKELQLPKNRLIENALELYLEQVEKASYIKSYQQAATDKDILKVAEEGMQEYFTELNDADSN
ncbi:ribbon-helix-helix domain-containing protein [Polaribacter undariae]|uniref:Ribbon-helix-helix domain-containing protein n=1 Tax=Polaribacter sejongensis TaxID=985043 RepID=A0AAJ1QU79_9FLAO|nr:ribbon-helix-helix domain-containing protein [Polaribacter undariae]MDN3618005.1 ribbon-helix-helix domain-containing protein [Polaribacter undariae]UWD31963.1 ribbon-helix-helix domain-containing protein [Polaribacter undariae]